MSGYVKSWTFKTEFDGDTVSVRLKPMSRLNALRLTALDVKDGNLDRQVLGLYGDVLPECVEAIDGLRDAAGTEIDLQTVLTDAYFTRLVALIGSELVSKASPANPSSPGSPPAA